jgi:hypothetical protein
VSSFTCFPPVIVAQPAIVMANNPNKPYTVGLLLGSARRGHQIMKEWAMPLDKGDPNLANLAALIDAFSLAPDKIRGKVLLKAIQSAYALGKSAGAAELAEKF